MRKRRELVCMTKCTPTSCGMQSLSQKRQVTPEPPIVCSLLILSFQLRSHKRAPPSGRSAYWEPYQQQV